MYRLRFTLLLFFAALFVGNLQICSAQNNIRLRYLDQVMDTTKDAQAHLGLLTYALLQSATEDSLYFIKLSGQFRKVFVSTDPTFSKTTDALLSSLRKFAHGDEHGCRPEIDSICRSLDRTKPTPCCWIDYIRLSIRNGSHEEYEHTMLDSSFNAISGTAVVQKLDYLCALIYLGRANYMSSHDTKPEYLGLTQVKYNMFDTAIQFTRRAKNSVLETKIAAAALRMYGLEDNLRQCQQMGLATLPVAIRLNDTASIYVVYSMLSSVNSKLKNYKEAERYALLQQELSEKIGEPSRLASSCGRLSGIYGHLNDTAQARKYGLLAIMYNDKAGNKYNAPLVIGNYGEVLFGLGFIDSAKYYQEIALEMRVKFGNQEGELFSYNSLAEIAIAEKNFALALSYCDKAQAIETQRQFVVYNEDLYHNYYDAYAGLHNYEKALQYLEKYVRIKANSDSLNNASEIVGMQADFDAAIAQRDFDRSILLEKLAADAEQQTAAHTRNLLLGGLAVLILVAGFILYGFTQKRKANQELSSKNSVIEHQKAMVEEKQKEILDSIAYAKRIQYTLLAHDELLQSHLPEHFVLFKPKDIVSGDFYWATSSENNGLFYLAVCDSTGHGVPGAFMSLLNISFLNEAIVEKKIVDTGAILNHVRSRLAGSVSKDGAQDGMDGTLLCFDKLNNRIRYSAAYNAPLLISGGVCHELSADKMPIGTGMKEQGFAQHSIEYTKGDMLYLFTDGYPDQFGGPKGKKFKYKQLQELLLVNHTVF